MLSIYYGDMEGEYVHRPSDYFDTVFEPEWLVSDLAKEIISDIDKSSVISPYCIESPVFGQISPQMLAGGTKALLIMYNEPEVIVNATACGDNCAKWILRIAEEKDITINLRYLMDFGKEDFKPDVLILNIGQKVKNDHELFRPAVEFLGQMG